MTVSLSPSAQSEQAYCHSPFHYRRRVTHEVKVGDVGVGGNNPIRVQSMTTTSTLDSEGTCAQVERLVRAGCEIVRITAPTVRAAQNLSEIRKLLRARHIDVPLVADIHFSPEAALEAANHIEKVRINPGNYADSRKFAVREYTDAEYQAELHRVEERFVPLVIKCKTRRIAMRIGTNHGSLSDRIVNRFGDTPEGMVESALEFVRICEKYDYDDVIISMKASNPKVMIAAYRLLAARMADLGMTYPFHLGVTEAGNGEDARIKSAVGIGGLLADGIGDTIRVSLAEEPEAEIPVAFALARRFPPRQDLAAEVQTPHHAISWDPYHYSRRNSAILEISEVAIGAAAPIAVMARPASSPPSAAAQVMRWTSPGIRRLARPELVEWLVENDSDVDHVTCIVSQVKSLRTLPLASEELHKLPRIGHVATSRHPSLLQHLSRTVDAVLWRSSSFPQAELDLLGHAAARGNKRLWLEADLTSAAAHQIMLQTLVDAAIRTRGRLGTDPVLSLYLSEPLTTIHSYRLLATLLHQVDLRCPVLLRYVEASDPLLTASFSIGSLLCDGIGDLVLVQTAETGQYDVQQTLNVLQGAGARLSKTDYVACPSCGRTLFDLQTTTDRIKQKTSHLVGVKIAIMGCVVNGPGEMADADFGYVGGSPGQVNLYVSKMCVERNVPAEVADERLIALIKEHGRWHEPEPAEDEAG